MLPRRVATDCWGVVWCTQRLQVSPIPTLDSGCKCASVSESEGTFQLALLEGLAARWPLARDANGPQSPAIREYARWHPTAIQYRLLIYGLEQHLMSPSRPPLADARGRHPLWLEFGVAGGGSANTTCDTLRLIDRPDARVVGFDTFWGLPTEWKHSGAPTVAGRFTQHGVPPPVRPCATLHKGLINSTLPIWTAQHHADTTTLLGVSIDVDLYSGTLDALTTLHAASLHAPKALLHFHDFVQPYGHGDSRLYHPSLKVDKPNHPFQQQLRRRARMLDRSHEDGKIDDATLWGEEARALYTFLRQTRGARWWLVPTFDPEFVIPVLFVVMA